MACALLIETYDCQNWSTATTTIGASIDYNRVEAEPDESRHFMVKPAYRQMHPRSLRQIIPDPVSFLSHFMKNAVCKRSDPKKLYSFPIVLDIKLPVLMYTRPFIHDTIAFTNASILITFYNTQRLTKFCREKRGR
jgi:hypothetical protein